MKYIIKTLLQVFVYLVVITGLVGAIDAHADKSCTKSNFHDSIIIYGMVCEFVIENN